VVDDEALIADTVADILNRHGHEAVAVYGSHDALQEASSFCPDVVLCDIIMPQVNGVETAMALRRKCPEARIILFSGQAASSTLLDQARTQGHEFEVLAKPIHPRELLRRLAPKQ
jgi:CheY-like chemotaxis protein